MDGGYLSDWLGTSYPRRGDFSILSAAVFNLQFEKGDGKGKGKEKGGEGRGWLDLSEMRGKSCPWQW